MKREELQSTEIYARFASEVHDDFGEVETNQEYYRKEQADSVMDELEARIKELEADKIRQENYCESLVNENKRLNEIIISKDMVGAVLVNENKALRHNLEDWKCENKALKARIKEWEDKFHGLLLMYNSRKTESED